MHNYLKKAVVKVEHGKRGCFTISVDKKGLNYQAGQFTKLGLYIGGKLVSKPYSFSSHPNDELASFYIIEVLGGSLTPSLAKLKVGDEIIVFTKASGVITPDMLPSYEELTFFVTGTAVGMALSLVKDPLVKSKYNNITILHGISDSTKICHSELFPSYVNYKAVVSKEHSNIHLNGRVWQHLDELNLSPLKSHVVLCGNPEMILEGKSILQNQYDFKMHSRNTKGNISVERYW